MADLEPTKICSLCKIPKPLSAYRVKKGKILARCRECNRARVREHRLKNKEKINAKEREWYSKNRDKEIAEVKRWQAAHPERVKTTSKAYRDSHKEERRQSFKEWRDAHPDYFRERHLCLYYADYEATRKRIAAAYRKYRGSILKRQREARLADPDAARREDRRQYAANKARRLASSKRWRLNNYVKYRILCKGYRLKRASAEGSFAPADIQLLLDVQNGKCAGCKKKLPEVGFHVDHVMPLARGGTNWPDNLELLCRVCNSRKHAKHPDDWAKEIGKLFV